MASEEDFKFQSFVSERAKQRKPHNFWSNVPKVNNPHPNPIQLIGGLPNYQFFPVDSIDVHLRNEPFSNNDEKLFTLNSVSPDNDNIIDIKTALQYSEVSGINPLLNQIKQFVKRVPRPITNNWDVVCTLGGSDGIGKTFDILINPGDCVLFEEFTFTPVIGLLKERGGIPIPIKIENILENSIVDYATELENLLKNWSTLKPNLPKPKVLYTIPNGHNPLGLAQSIEHKKKIYKLAETYNFIILEDEPYSYLNFDKYNDPNTNFNLTNDEFINSLNPSYKTIDVSDRVIRVETFSKIFAPGMRLGFIVAHPKFIPYYNSSAALFTRSPNGYSQIFLNNTIIQLGGIEGWIKWIIKVRNEYLKRKNVYVTSLINSKAYEKGYLNPIDPNCGMFVPIIVNVKNHKNFNGENFDELMDQFYIKAVQSGVLVVLGRNMTVDNKLSASRSNFIRTAICYVDSHDILKEAVSRLNEATINFFEDTY
ncbi:hypothetical protein C6P40_002919 [Pichia californica]|uniref:Aminotransferase class I/classII large domain-containing protein n=1 Tax=Pichia californica TaxID=460514 RepID=A0A9P6WNN0_9ASCO|nr:hypothetical protein C6P42_002778 [[Candida] californica]KAG0690426.1 hypothetical protein C6P40_002919 [[Candida] californica]